MKIRYVVLLTCLVPIHSQAQASGKSVIIGDRAAVAAAAERSATLDAAGRGATLTSNGQTYQVLPGARAVENRTQDVQQTLAQVGGGKLIESKGNLVVYSSTHKGGPTLEKIGGVTTYATVLNANTGVVGILPGTISVRLKSMGDASSVASSHRLELIRKYVHLQKVYYRVQPGQDVISVAAALLADARVETAEVEVLEHLSVPQ
jgi:hypothetical protein